MKNEKQEEMLRAKYEEATKIKNESKQLKKKKDKI